MKMTDGFYLGRFQQGTEIAIVLQCTDASNEADDPLRPPVAQIYQDGADPVLIATVTVPADLRGVERGVFRVPLFLNDNYSAPGRYLVVLKWSDLDGVARGAAGAFHLLPGGGPDGTAIAMHFSSRPDATYLLMQCDSGRLIRKANPR